MSGESQQVHALELLEAAGEPEMALPPAAIPAKGGEEEEALRLVAQLGFSLAPKLTGIASNTHKLAFKLHVAANVVAVTLDLLLVVYLLLIFTRTIKPPVRAAAKRLMWAALAATYVTFLAGIFIQLLA